MEREGNVSEAAADKDKSVSSQVLEYYQKYSLSSELPKYFCGTSGDWNKLPVKKPDERYGNVPVGEVIEQKITPSILPERSSWTQTEQDLPTGLHVERATSPASSVASNRKLEWDNGADIGYSNVTEPKTLQKSISLPVLSDVEYEKLRGSLLGDKIDLQKREATSSTSSETPKSLQGRYSSSSTSEELRKKPSSSSETHSESLQQVGLPIAESTPLVRIRSDSEISNAKKKEKLSSSCEDLSNAKVEEAKRWHSQVDLSMVDRISHYKNLKVLKLCVSKPVVVECVGAYEAPPTRCKISQTSLPRGTSIAVQTDFDLSNAHVRRSSPRYIEKQSVVYVRHSDSDQGAQNFASTQTDSDVVSNCNSFEYLNGVEYDQNLQKLNVLSNLKRCPPKSDLTTVTPLSNSTSTANSSQISSKESPLAQLLSCKQSDYLIPDLEIKLSLLQKVIKSRKYDPVTKKYYLKKIVEKMIDTKYVDDSSEKASDVDNYQPDSESGAASSEKEPNLQDNKPWKPVPQTSRKSKPKLQTQTFVNAILPDTEAQFIPIQVVHNQNDRLQRNPLFTLSHGLTKPEPKPEDVNKVGDQSSKSSNSTANELYEVLQPVVAKPVLSPLSKQNTSDDVKSDYQSWRENKTRSEQLLERKSGDSESTAEKKDHLLSFAKKEREHQLYWINNEISHLSKLKQLLERKRNSTNGETKDLSTILQKPHIEDMRGIKKSTTVYVVTTEKNTESTTGGCQNCKCIHHYGQPDSEGSSSSKNVKVLEVAAPTVQSQCTCVTKKTLSRKGPRPPVCDCPTALLKRPSLIGNGENVVEVGDEKISLKNARLVTSEQFTTKGAKSSRTSIRRYTFEIPMDCITSSSEDSQTAAASGECVPCCRGPCAIARRRSSKLTQELVSSDEIVAAKPSTDVSQPASKSKSSKTSSDFTPQTQSSKTVSRESSKSKSVETSTETVDSKVSKGKGSESFEVSLKSPDLRSPRFSPTDSGSISSRKCSISRGSQASNAKNQSVQVSAVASLKSIESKGMQATNQETKSMQYSDAESKHFSSKSLQVPSTKSKNFQVSDVPTPKPSKSKGSQASNQASTGSQTCSGSCVAVESKEVFQEIARDTKGSQVYTDLKGSHTRTGSSQTNQLVPEPTEPPKAPKPPPEVPPSPEPPRQSKPPSKAKKREETSSSSSSESASASSSSSDLCQCCKQKPINKPKRQEPCEDREEFYLCQPCHVHYQNGSYGGTKPYYTYGHVCQCYDGTMQKIKDTLQKLSDLEEEEYCRCAPKNRKQTSSGYCARCQCKLNKKHKTRKGGLAYMLTIEEEDRKHKKKKAKKKARSHELPEIKVKVESPRGKVKSYTLTDDYVQNSEDSSKENGSISDHKHKKHKKKQKKPTLQDYLCANKPDFVTSAEQRRQALIDLAFMREKRCEKYKQLLALTNNLPSQNSQNSAPKKPRVFAPEEVKAITAKKYKTLPEVQRKLDYRKEQQIKKANKLLSNIFNEKLRQRVLRGKHTLAMDASVISFVK